MPQTNSTPKAQTPQSYSLTDRLGAHLSIARLDHSVKNVFVLPGILVAYTAIGGAIPAGVAAQHIVIGFLACTLIACSNYVLNEVLDAPYDRHHPAKRNRPAASGRVHIPAAYAQWLGMTVVGLLLGSLISLPFTASSPALWITGCA